ncbi:substrate-binding domain-containing protein [Embleya scabrispora]|nr:substrate-binding domain-containing protein [Embleya scabrispora]
MSKRSGIRGIGTAMAVLGTAMALVVGADASAVADTHVNGGAYTLEDVTRMLTTDYEANVDPSGSVWITVGSGTSRGGIDTHKAACDADYGIHGPASRWPGIEYSATRTLLDQRAHIRENCLDFARVSGATFHPDSDETSLTWVRVAGDAVTWATGKAGVPSNLTRGQLQDIYRCNFTDWSQIPGSSASGPIQKYLPTGRYSDVRAVFVQYVLGFDPTQPANGPCAATVADAPGENRGDYVTSPNAILPYTKSAYSAQKNPLSGVPDHTGGFRLGNIDGRVPGQGRTDGGDPNAFVGNHSVYFVYDPFRGAANAATVDFINWAKDPAQRVVWATYGFLP